MFKKTNIKDYLLVSLLAVMVFLFVLFTVGMMQFNFPVDPLAAEAEAADSLEVDSSVPISEDASVPSASPSGVAFAKGVDISHNNGQVSLAEIKKAGITFVYAKATQGTYFHDPLFQQNWSSAGANGLIRGAYHFLDLDHAALATSVEASAEAQATYFLSTVSFAPGDLPPMLDLEQYSNLTPDEVARCAKKWLDVVAAKTGTKPILYIEKSFWMYEMECSDLLKDYPLWIADINHSEQPLIPSCWSNWSIWQYSDSKEIEGITTTVFDMDVYNGTPEQLKAFVAQYGFKTAPSN